MTDAATVGSMYPRARRATPVAIAGGNTLAIALTCVALFLLLNPLLAVFILALVALFRPIPSVAYIVPAALAFTLFYYFRDYGVEWYPASTDDVPNYISIYQSTYGLSFSDLLARTLTAPNGNEPLWLIPCWAFLNVFNGSDDTFVFLHYLIIFLAQFAALSMLSRRYLAPLALVYLFLTPISLDAMAHVWRQQLAFSMFLGGVGLYMIRGSRPGLWLIILSPLMHMAAIFFVLSFFTFRWIRRHNGFDNKLKFSVILVVILTVIPALSKVAIFYLDALGAGKIMSYFEGYGADITRVYMIIGLYAVPLLAAFYLLKSDDTNNLFMILCFAVFSIVLALPAANGVYDRLLMFALPFLGFCFFRLFLINCPIGWGLALLPLIFVIGVVRLYEPTTEGSGVMEFLAFGHGFDPLMGIVKMLVKF